MVELGEVVALKLLECGDNLLVCLGLVRGRLDQENERHVTVIVLCDKDLLEVS